MMCSPSLDYSRVPRGNGGAVPASPGLNTRAEQDNPPKGMVQNRPRALDDHHAPCPVRLPPVPPPRYGGAGGRGAGGVKGPFRRRPRLSSTFEPSLKGAGTPGLGSDLCAVRDGRQPASAGFVDVARGLKRLEGLEGDGSGAVRLGCSSPRCAPGAPPDAHPGGRRDRSLRHGRPMPSDPVAAGACRGARRQGDERCSTCYTEEPGWSAP